MDIGTLTGRIEIIDTSNSVMDKFLLRLGNAETKMETFGRRATAAGQALTTGVTLPLLAMGAGALTAAIQFESSFAGVRKTVDATEEEFAQLSATFRGLSKEIPVSVNELNRIAEAGGQLGVAKEDIAGFTRTMADMGVATNLSSDQAAEGLAQIANIMNNELGPQYDKLASTIVDLGNKSAATESMILEFGLRLSGAGKVAGLTEAEILGMGTALASVGINAEAGGTAFSKVMIEIASAASTGGAKLDGFAKTAGMSSAEFKKAFETDAAGAVISFVEGLGNIDKAGGNLFKTLENLGITEQRMRDALLRSAGAGDLLRASIVTGNQAWKDNNALTIEAEKRYATTESKLLLLKNKIYDVGISLGGALLPALSSAVGMFEKFIPYIDQAVKAFSAMPEPVQMTTVALLGFSAAVGPIVWMAGKLAESFSALLPMFVSTSLAGGKLAGMLSTLTWPFRVIIDQIGIFGVKVGISTSAALLWSSALAKITPVFMALSWPFRVVLDQIAIFGTRIGLSTSLSLLWSTATKGVWALLAANPIAAVVGAIGALLLGVRALTGSWEFLTKPLGHVWQGLKDIWTVTKDSLAPVLEDLSTIVSETLTPVFDTFNAAIKEVVGTLQFLWKVASQVPGPLKSILDGTGFDSINERANAIRSRNNYQNWIAYPDMPVEAFNGGMYGSSPMVGGWGPGKVDPKKGTGGGTGGTVSEDYKKALDEMHASLLTTDMSVRAFRDTFASLTPTQLANIDVQRRVVDEINNLRSASENVTPAMLAVESAFLASENAAKLAGVAKLESLGITNRTIEANLKAGMSEAAIAAKYGVRVTSLQALMDKQAEQAAAAAGLYEFEQIAARDAADRKVYSDQRVIESGQALIEMQRFTASQTRTSYQQQIAAIDAWAAESIMNTKAVGADLVAFTSLVEREAARQKAAITANVDRAGIISQVSSAAALLFGGPAGKKTGEEFKSSFAEAISDIGSIIIGALQGGGNVGASIGATLGKGIGEDLAKNLLGDSTSKFLKGALSFLGPLGSLAGGAVGKFIGGLFGPSKGKQELLAANAEIAKGREELLKTYGTLQNIAALDKALGTDVAAGWAHQGQKGLAAFNKSAEELAERLKKVHDEMATITAEGGLASNELRRFRDAMSGDATVQEFSLGQVQQAGGNIGGMLNSMQEAATARARQDIQAQINALELLRSTATGSEIETQIEALEEQLSTVRGQMTLTATGAQAMASILLAAWDGSAQRLRDMQPSLSLLQEAMHRSGIEWSDAFQSLTELAGIAASEIQGPMVDAINFGTAALTNMSNSGFLTQETFAGIVDEIMAQRQALIASGASAENVSRLMQPSLQRIWELHRDTGMEIDEETRALLEQAEAQGRVGDRFRSATDRMVIALEHIAEMFDTVFGDTLIAAVDRGTTEAERRLRDLTRDREINVHTRYDASEGNPEGGPGVTNGGGGGTAEVYIDSERLARVMVPAHARVVQDYHLG